MDENGVITEAFQSTPSVWRETLREKPRLKAGVYFNPLPPCGGRRCRIGQRIIHGEFQSTPSVWRETTHDGRSCVQCDISIHSLRVEGDICCCRVFLLPSPFQSTPSVWRETSRTRANHTLTAFQSTPSVWRETCNARPCYVPVVYFNPLPPCGGRPIKFYGYGEGVDFNPLPPCGGRHKLEEVLPDERYFNPLPPCGGRPFRFLSSILFLYFNPLPPCGGRRAGIIVLLMS